MTTETMSKAKSLTLVGIAYIVAIAVGAAWLVWGAHTGRLWLDTLVADVLATLVIFAFSRMYGNSSFYDAYWSVIPPVLLFYWYFRRQLGRVAGLAAAMILPISVPAAFNEPLMPLPTRFTSTSW